MKGRKSGTRTQFRRATQLAFLVLFFVLVFAARPEPGREPPLFLKGFFLLDPLLLAVTFVAAHAVPLILLVSLVVVAATLLFGRVFCGWFCPLGTLHAIVGWCADRLGSRKRRRDHWTPWHRAKYYVLILFLGAALVGGHWITIFDPLVLLYRTAAVSLLPAFQWAVETGSTTVYQADPHAGPLHLTALTEPVYQFFRNHVWGMPRQAFLGTGSILGFFLLILAANFWRRRFWCRYLCPLGALLGLIARRPWLRRAVDPDSCTRCDLCASDCHGAASEKPGEGWRASECFVCFNCAEACPQNGVRFKWRPFWRNDPPAEGPGISRRAALTALAGGIAAQAAFRATPQGRGNVYHPRLIRPPGARPEAEFLERCTACGMCMKVCPTGGLQPALGEAGLEGLWTPRLVPHLGYCAYDCNACGHACPTEAIRPLSLEEKHTVRIGLAAFDTTRCIPYAYGRDCMVCEEHCPVPDKAIYFQEVTITARDGSLRKVKQPHVDPNNCIGCGTCENVCVLKDAPGVRVFSSNESRHPDNQPILPEIGGETGGYSEPGEGSEEGSSPY